MRQHRLALCKDHYLEWFINRTQKSIEKFHMFSRDAKILVAVSGGKDSLALWDVLWRLGYNVHGMHIHLGIDGDAQYSNLSDQTCRNFAESRELPYHVLNIAEVYGESVPEINQRKKRGQNKPCSLCGLIKRYAMNKYALDKGYDVIVTAHNLDDEAAVLYANTLQWDVDLMSRQYPVLEAQPGFARKAKPFCKAYERETAAYALLRGIDYVQEKCPYSTDSQSPFYKELLNKMEAEKPGTKLHFYSGFLNASKKKKLFPDKEKDQAQIYSQPCPKCGQPTTSEDLCAFCRLFE
jgi:uncharacterized protein (TIGR00269 family)